MSAYIERPVDGWAAIRTSELAELQRDRKRLDWLDRQYQCKDSWNDVWVMRWTELRKLIDKAQEAE